VHCKHGFADSNREVEEEEGRDTEIFKSLRWLPLFAFIVHTVHTVVDITLDADLHSALLTLVYFIFKGDCGS
jgi:hypothetical protein